MTSRAAEAAIAWLRSVGSADGAKVLAHYAPGARFEVTGVFAACGLEQLRALHEFDAAVGTRFSPTVVVAGGEGVRLRLRETSEWLRLAGIAELVHDPCEVTVRDGLVVAAQSALKPDDADALERAWRLLAGWMRRQYPAELERLAPQGVIVRDRQCAERWLALLRRRQKSAGG